MKKQKQKELINKVIEADEKDGLYEETAEEFLKDRPIIFKCLERLEYDQIVMAIMQKYADYVLSEKMPFDGFWERLKSFIADIETSDCPGEEEKEMILSVCEQQLKQ